MKEFFKSLLKMIIAIITIFMIPFIPSVILKVFINFHFFIDIDEFKNMMTIFNNIYVISYIVIGIIILLWFFHKWSDIKNIIQNMNFSIAVGDKKISAEHIREEMKNIDEQKEFINKIAKQNNNNESANIIKEVKSKLGISKDKGNKKCKECNKEELKEENEQLRYFATYNVINTEARILLHMMYNEKFVARNTFKSKIIQGYKKRNKRNIKFTKKEINKIAENKYDTIFEGLKFLNIIEPSEDDQILKLTQNGKKFVEKYIEKKEVV